ncbi:unnamed protein product [Rotaria magnacalcarata]|uniref:Uncharacterized protein n=1 Tax=Rotaria magnacalcarata TaxID=392030 RepID=A0A816TPU2_9BILA|nr:unnamed protein product [Rotaria magnacalcarata]CAF2102941.1 unnamed protein product [Rotaria magnacalcarata]
MISNPCALDILIKNFNHVINHNVHDTDLMYDYRHASQAKQHPILKNNPDSLLFQLYIDEIGLTNPIGAKKDTQKITMLHFQLIDFPDTVRSMLKSIGRLAMCHTKYLSVKSNRMKFFEPIVEELNAIQTTGIFIPALGRQLHFAFTVLAGDNLGSNDIGGFQKNFNNGQFCRHCHINYDQRLVPLSQISHPHRTKDQHDNLVQQVINLNNDFILQGVADISPFSKLIGFHATTSLPSDLMHDFNEGLCGQILLAMIKEASNKRILSYGEIEERLISFDYGPNDKSNKGPALRKKHLNKGKIVGTASQKICLFKLFPIIFHDIIDALDTKEIYICLREIISLVYACPFRKSWLSYLHSLTIRFQSLVVHMRPNLIIPKVHFASHYAKQIEMYGPCIRHWCMRFESKHQMFKQLAVKSNNFKNILYTLSKRHQLRQCFLLSLPNYYEIIREGYSSTEKHIYALPADVRKLLQGKIAHFDDTTTVMEYQRLKFDHVMFIKGSVFVNNLVEEEEIPSFLHVIFILKIANDWLLIVEQLETVAFNESLWVYELEHTHLLSMKQPNELIHVLPKGLDIYVLNGKSYVNILSREDIDGETLFNLPQSIMYEIIKTIKERVRFLAEHRTLFHGVACNNSDPIASEKYIDNSLDNNSQQVIEQRNTNQLTTMSTITFSDNHPSNDSAFDSSTDSEAMNDETMISSKENDAKENYNDEEQHKGEINHFRGHTNARRLLLDAIFADVTTKYSLLYPDTHEYRSMAIAILEKLNVKNDTEALNDWTESLKSKFKRERRPLQQISEEVLKMKLKFGNSAGRPVKQNDNVIAARREVQVEFWNKADVNDDPQDFDEHIQFMKTELGKENRDLDSVKVSWKKTLIERRSYVQNHTTQEVLQEYPGYRNTSLIFDEIQYLCNVDIEANLRTMLPKLLTNVPDNLGFVNDLPIARLIKLLSRCFTESWKYVLTYKEPLSPRPTIQVTTDKYVIYFDYDIITETASIDQALCIIISLYVIFELQFGTHNRIVHLLYGILLQEPAALTKPLRLILKEWNFTIDKKERKQANRLSKITSINNSTHTASTKDLENFDETESSSESDEEPQEAFTTTTDNLHPLIETKKQLSMSTVTEDVQNPPTTMTLSANKDNVNKSSKVTSSSAQIDSKSQINFPSSKEANIEASTSILSNKNTSDSVNSENRVRTRSNQLSSKQTPKHTSPPKRRLHSPEGPISSRVVPTDESIILRYVIETLFIIHGETKLNMICPIGIDPEKLYGPPYDHQWYYHIKHPELPTAPSILSLIQTIKELNERPSNEPDDDDDN